MKITDARSMVAHVTYAAERYTRCRRRGCGAALTPRDSFDTTLIVMNGPTASFECDNVQGACGCAHAEQKIACHVPKTCGRYDLYVTFSPCSSCAVLLALWREQHVLDLRVSYGFDLVHDMRGLQILNAADILTQKVAMS